MSLFSREWYDDIVDGDLLGYHRVDPQFKEHLYFDTKMNHDPRFLPRLKGTGFVIDENAPSLLGGFKAKKELRYVYGVTVESGRERIVVPHSDLRQWRFAMPVKDLEVDHLAFVAFRCQEYFMVNDKSSRLPFDSINLLDRIVGDSKKGTPQVYMRPIETKYDVEHTAVRFMSDELEEFSVSLIHYNGEKPWTQPYNHFFRSAVRHFNYEMEQFFDVTKTRRPPENSLQFKPF